jgi:hypothetical protein
VTAYDAVIDLSEVCVGYLRDTGLSDEDFSVSSYHGIDGDKGILHVCSKLLLLSGGSGANRLEFKINTLPRLV